MEERNGGNPRNRTRAKTVLTDNAGAVWAESPRPGRQVHCGDRGQAATGGSPRVLDAVVGSLYTKGLTTERISAIGQTRNLWVNSYLFLLASVVRPEFVVDIGRVFRGFRTTHSIPVTPIMPSPSVSRQEFAG